MIFLDSSFIIAYYNIDDQNHSRAVVLMDEISDKKYGDIVITDYIFDECVTIIFMRLKDIKKAIGVGEAIRESMFLKFLNEEEFESAWAAFKSQDKTRFSFTDCSIIAFMRDKNINNLATFDGDFKKVNDINIKKTMCHHGLKAVVCCRHSFFGCSRNNHTLNRLSHNSKI